MKPEGSLPWIISHLQGHFPSSLYKIVITTFLKELASKMFWIFFVQRQWKKSSLKWYYFSCETTIRTYMLQFITIFFKIPVNLVLTFFLASLSYCAVLAMRFTFSNFVSISCLSILRYVHLSITSLTWLT